MSVRPATALLSRRAFLAMPVAGAAAAACRRGGPPFDPAAFSIPKASVVGLFSAADYRADLSDVIFRGLQELRVDVRGRSVLLKPNMVEFEEGHAINTDPLMIAGAIVALRRAGARQVLVGEGPGHRRDVEYLLSSTGIGDHLRELHVEFVDLNHDDVREVPLRSWFTGLRSLALPASLLRADLVVSMPKLKTHHWAGLTCSMKNLFGVVPGAVYGWPKNVLHVKGIHASILDLVATVRPSLAIVDAIVGMEGDGPIMGRGRSVGIVAMGTDLAAVDATCARLVGLDPAKMTYLSAADRFLGNIRTNRIELRGERLDRHQTNFELIDTMKHLRG